MMATVSKSSDISHSLTYVQNKEKDGGILFANLTDLSATPEEQARDWEALSNDYKTKCYNIVISFTPNETHALRSMSDNGRNKVSTLIKEFLQDLSGRGNDVSECPFVVARHDNTDNEHYHICILATDINGNRFSDSFINKNATRAAAKVAMDNNLEGAKKAMEREKAHQEATGKSKKEKKTRYHAPSDSQEKINDRLSRKRAVEEAKKRKASLAFIINHVAQQSNKYSFMDNLSKEGITLRYDEKKGLVAEIVYKDSKPRTYSLVKDLGIDPSILPDLPSQPVKQDTISTKVKTSTHTPVSTKINYTPKSFISTGLNSVGGTGVNREWEVGTKKRSPDDPDEEVKRKGMSY
ncbi:MAG: relaxase/mobilization nuclease domain-containing protein [Muribaculaceae bacterium]|nr:relaxase/mobilization nuclease domain-containing protein [Muribaculaceae bacterium]